MLADADRRHGRQLARAAFVATVVLSGGILWVVPRPGMGDLAQHAAQVAMLHDLLAGTSPWRDLVRVNYFTPYLVGYGLALPLSFMMPVASAIKLVLTLACYAFVGACVALRRTFHDDDRLDWLFVPGFFGFAFQYGFFTFLVSAPVGIAFLCVARRYAGRPTIERGVRLLAFGVVLFFCHALVFLFACAVAGGFLLVERRSVRRVVASLAPFVGLGALCIAYFVYVRRNDPLIAAPELGPSVDFEWTQPWGWHRAFNFPLYVFASGGKDTALLALPLVFLAAPWLMGWRIDWANRATLVPFAVVLVFWFFVPAYVLKTAFVYQRYAIFLLPSYALLFRPAAEASAFGRVCPWIVAVLGALCVAFLGTMARRERQFAAESADFETLLAATEPGQRALGLVYAPASRSIRNAYTFHAYPVWYQVDKGGFVDFNFASFLPQIVRFRNDRFPSKFAGLNETPETFDWRADRASIYRYFFVKHDAPLPPHLFDNDECVVVPRVERGEWSLFERTRCR